MMKHAKISIIGAGNVGATAAHMIASKELGDIVLVDRVEGIAKGKALDLLQAGPIESFNIDIKGTNKYQDTRNSDIVIITAGVPRRPGMSRDDLIKTNTKIVKEVTKKIAKYSPNAILIVVTNPLDAMVYIAAKVSKFPKKRVLGMGGNLDATRFRTFISKELDVSVENVDAIVLGGHGDSMLPLPRYSTINGIPVTKLLTQKKINAIVERTKKGGIEIVNLLKTGSAFYAPAASIVEIVEAIIKDKKRILPCAAYCDKEYGVNGFFVGVPARIGNSGVEHIMQLKLTDEEKKNFNKSIKHVKELIKMAEKFL